MKKEIKIAYTLFFIVVFGYLIRYELNIFLAHHLPPATYGDYSIAIKLLGITIILALFGTRTGSNRFLARYLALNKKSTANDYIAWNVKLISVTFLVLFAVAAIAIFTMVLLHVLGIRHISQYHLAVYMLWIAPFDALTFLLCSYLLISGHVFMSRIIGKEWRYLLELIFFVILFLLLHRNFHTMSIVAVLLTTSLVALITTLLASNKEILGMIQSGFKKISYTRLSHEKWFPTSLKMIGSDLIYAIVNVIDLIIVALIVVDKAVVGHYAAVLMICGWIWLSAEHLYQLVISKASHLLSSQEGKVELQNMVDRTNKVVFLSTGVISMSIIYFSSTLLAYFGPSYTNARYALIIMALGAFVEGIFHFSLLLLTYAGFERITLILNAWELAMIILLAVPATYFFGITGTAAAVAVVIVAQGIAGVYFVRKKIGMRSTLWF
ncbi:MAG: hypothetical protein JSS53_00885 [Proteobacteria bacterium]|nr:hypothetical protein [Pseudomonadota bacterium]